MQGLLEQLYNRLAKQLFKHGPAVLARILHEMGTEEAVHLLQRDDLCCPVECFLVEVGGTIYWLGRLAYQIVGWAAVGPCWSSHNAAFCCGIRSIMHAYCTVKAGLAQWPRPVSHVPLALAAGACSLRC